MKVTLINCTPDPVCTIIAAWWIMHNQPVYDVSIDPTAPNDKIYTDGFGRMAMNRHTLKNTLIQIESEPHKGALEMVNFNFLIEGVSRAFQQQLTRTRQASYCIQSLRVVDQSDFADKERYLRFEGKTGNEKWNYEFAMKIIQEQYVELLKNGASIKDARGILPLAIHSPIWFNINLRYFINLMNKVKGDDVQGEFKEAAAKMIIAIQDEHPLLAEVFLTGKANES